MLIPTYSNENVYLRTNNNAVSSVTATIWDGDPNEMEDDGVTPVNDWYPVTVTQAEPGLFYFPMLYSLTQEEKTYNLVWSYDVTENGAPTTITRTEPITIYTEYANPFDLQAEIDGLEVLTVKQIRELETTARNIIDEYTGKHFGYRRNITIATFGTGTNRIYVPARIVKITDVSHATGTLYPYIRPYAEGADELFLLAAGSPFYDIKADAYITSPVFASGVTYYITGDFGWRTIPQEVSLATKMLVQDLISPEFELHRKNIQTTSTEGRSITYATPHLETTGNVVVDQMLRSYRKPRMLAL